MTILIVDDNVTSRKWLRATLEAEGHRTLQAVHGAGALKVLAPEPIDALISDSLMPKMDGYQLCHELRRDERFRHLPVIIYTSTYTERQSLGLLGMRERALSVGATLEIRSAPGRGTTVSVRLPLSGGRSQKIKKTNQKEKGCESLNCR